MSSLASSISKLVGRELAGFSLAEIVGEGGMAVVFRATNVLSPTIQRAIKIVRPELAAREEFVRRFAEEALTLERLQHTHVVRFYGLRVAQLGSDSLLLMELEFLEGYSLGAAAKRAGGPANVAEATRWLTQASEGVAAAHRLGVVHRDLKPDNLFLTQDGLVKVLDFGLARALDDADRLSTITVAGTVPGSPPYMAPEVCNGAVPNATADVYALGISLYELLLGYHPYTPPGKPHQSATQLMFAQVSQPLPPLRALRPEVSVELERVLQKATAKAPEQRYRDARELADALGSLSFPATSKDQAALRTQFAVPTFGAAVTPMAVASPSVDRAGVAAKPARKISFGKLVPYVAGLVLILGFVGTRTLQGAREQPVEKAASAAPAPPVMATSATNPFVQVSAAKLVSRRVRDTRPLLGVTAEERAAERAARKSNARTELARPVLGLGDAASAQALGFRKTCNVQAPERAFAIQQHEVTWEELSPFLVGHPQHAFDPPSHLPEAAQRAHLPATGVPWDTAYAYCQSLGGNLPTEEQWEYAARGEDLRPAPWGAARLDLSRTHAFAGKEPRPRAVMTSDQDMTPREGGAIFDLAGNAQEWTLDVYRSDRPGEDESWTQSGVTSFRAVRGLPLQGEPERGLQAEIAAYRNALCATGKCPDGTAEALKYVGFRCVKTP